MTMAGRINEEDIALVRERARIDDVVGSHVALRNAGGGSLKGLCPFHDEKTPSVPVTPARGFFHCFGCGEGGDVITFVQKVSNLSFVEAVQQLADRVGIQLRITEDGSGSGLPSGMRSQILAANAAAADWFSAQLLSPDALAGRQFIDQRGFDRADADHFGIGYAPRGGRELRQVLNRAGFSDEVLVTAGLIRQGGWDFFQGRLLWPIRDSASSVLGFGARKLYDDDRMPAKYLNTPETPVYKKSHVLYGLDLARTAIGKKAQAVVVEGYTDVMAAHLSGVDTAVASCGTAFGDDHARLLQRLMGNHDAFNGEVVFTFDGDAAGQKAALKVFNGDQNFITQTYVAIEPHGLDPCDLRLEHGDAAVRELVGRRIPLYQFVMSNVLSGYDLDRADGRLAALRASAPLVSSIRDSSLISGYARELAGMLGMDVDEVRSEIQRIGRRRVTEPAPDPRTLSAPAPEPDALLSALPLPDPAERSLLVERGTLKLMVQFPLLFDAGWDEVTPADFSHPAYRAVFELLSSIVYHDDTWLDQVRAASTDEVVSQLLLALVVEPVLRTPDEAYASAYAARLRLLRVTYDIKNLKSKLQRTNPVEQTSDYNAMFSTLLGLEGARKQLQQVSLGALD